MTSFKAYPWQERAIKEGIFRHQNMVLCWPTSSGKTHILLEAMLQKANQGKKSVLILPGVDSVKEKADTLWKEHFHTNIEIAYVYQGKTFFKSRKRKRPPIEQCRIIIATYESLDKLLRKDKTKFENIDLIAADEIHKIYNEDRGDTADKVVTWLRYLNSGAQVIFSMATQSGVQELAKWIKGKVLIEDKRPTDIATLIYCLKTRSFIPVNYDIPSFLSKIEATNEVEFYIQLKKIIEQYNGQCLIFNGTRARTVSYALEYLTYKESTGETLDGKIFDKLISAKTGYVNAGLSKKARDIMIDAYRGGNINTLHTTTLIAESFDSDTNMVVISDIELAGQVIDPADLEQMLGRIRKPFHAARNYPFGIGIILARNEEHVSGIQNILGSSPDFNSKLEIYDSFLDQMLSLLKYYNWEETENILRQTFFAFLKKEEFIEYLHAGKQDLEKIGFVDAQAKITPQAEAVVQYFIPTYIAKKLISMKEAFHNLNIDESLEMLCTVSTKYRFTKFGKTPSTSNLNKVSYTEGISDIQAKSRFMTKEQLHTFLLLHINALSYKEIKKVFKLGSHDFTLLMQQIGRYLGFISQISEDEKIKLLKCSFEFGIPPAYAKILPPRFPKRNEYHIKFRELVRQSLEKGEFEPDLLSIFENLDREVWDAFFLYDDDYWDFEETGDILIHEGEFEIVERYLEEEGLHVRDFLDFDPSTRKPSNCIEAIGKTFALRVYTKMNFKGIGDKEKANDLSQDVLYFVIESREESNLEEFLDKEFDGHYYEIDGRLGYGDDNYEQEY